MSGIDPLHGGAIAADASREGRLAPDSAGRWRRELERAQWNLRPPAGPAAGAPPSGATAAPHEALRSPLPTAPAATKAPPHPQRQDGEAAAFQRAPAEPAAARASATPSLARPAATALLSNSPVDRGRPTLPALPAVVPRMPRPAARGDWQPTHLHAYRGPQGLRLWIRDASLDTAAGMALARDLRRRLAAAGITFDGLVLNGAPVEGPGDSFSSN
jgi:hypothetical protein